ncbi:PilZ domain-containing protein [Geosporobacter ferrireducens]|uniref:PilZ domain-containing protein n=1 Tax=Geosporobacter ferrireducens TaxID=1424294 RepID=UPI0023539ECC|nr:PilZ domain-containing protein [Geosporobacter ferrireducens]
MEMRALNDKREYFRIRLNHPLCATMTIVLVDGQPMKTGSTNVCIKDIGPGGLRFMSHLKLPESKKVILEFDARICGQDYQFWGSVIRTHKKEAGVWEYGVEFYIDEATRSKYVYLFNQLAIKLYKYKQWHSCSICTKDEPAVCLRSRDGEGK